MLPIRMSSSPHTLQNVFSLGVQKGRWVFLAGKCVAFLSLHGHGVLAFRMLQQHCHRGALTQRVSTLSQRVFTFTNIVAGALGNLFALRKTFDFQQVPIPSVCSKNKTNITYFWSRSSFNSCQAILPWHGRSSDPAEPTMSVSSKNLKQHIHDGRKFGS